MLSQVALLSQIPRKLRQFKSELLPPIPNNYKCSLVSTSIMVALFTFLLKIPPFFILSFTKRQFGIGLTQRSLLCTPYAMHYTVILVLLCQTLPSHSKLKVMHLILLYIVYLYRSMHLFANPLPSWAIPLPVVVKTTVFMTIKFTIVTYCKAWRPYIDGL